MRPTTIRIVTLALALAAPAAQACAVAEGCPMGDPPRSCATVRIDADHVCIDDPTALGGVLILPRGGTVPADAPDCGLAGGGCVMPLPDAPAGAGYASGAGPALPLLGLLALIGVVATR